MGADRDRDRADRFPATSARLRALGRQAQARVYRASGRHPGPPRRSRFTGRAAVLAFVVCTLVVALAYPTRQYVAQRAEIAEQRKQTEQARERVAELRRTKARWQDPAYVKAQARERLHYVQPGETGFTVVAPEQQGDAERSASRTDAGRTWYDKLWRDVDRADSPRAAAAR
ncbi:acyl-phosphate glycerol 3-phosphate acyltransferase [Wenjunlia vitaminophila]|uniref:Acyl-phosphate glycerol 3-phosphate acyltransferase n=1 Tax=Wenjunlia vitaminophila TaxID=76728 RepID=A0A0T6LRY2_WENVI|nr:septum formation initiator family protein [Wenjunlia vitaminophila]KRV48816.1 acyl-phosphate glycerol 3-phosphate acyltransferase [Wenjunlia vitaminophila]